MSAFQSLLQVRFVALLILLVLGLSGCELFDNRGEDDTGDTEQPRPLELPEPTGAFRVGTTPLYLTDASREETYTAQAGDARELAVQIWYPTDTEPTTTVPYMHPDLVTLFSAFQDYTAPDSLITFLNALETNTTADAPVSPTMATYPVVFFSHGLSGVRYLESTYIEELASHGYIVVGIDHTYGAFASVFPNNRVVFFSTNQPSFPQIVDIWAEDLSFVLDELARLNISDPTGRFTGRLNLNQVGAMGHSTGGSAAVQVHVEDPRFKAGISLDAPQVGDATTQGLDEPFMFMFANPSEYFETTIQGQLRARGYNVTINNTTHYSFTDLPFLIDLAGVSPSVAANSTRPPGTIDPAQNLEIINGLTVAFFDRHLRGETVPLLDGGQPFSGITFEVLNPSASPVVPF